MKHFQNLFLILILLFQSFTLVAHEPTTKAKSEHTEEEENSTRFGPGKAVEAFDKEEGFKLSQKAMQSLGIKFAPLKGNGPWSVPSQAIIKIKQSNGIYRKYEDWISMVVVKVVGKKNDQFLIQSQDLEPEDEIAIQGASFLRMTDADLNSGTVDSCTH